MPCPTGSDLAQWLVSDDNPLTARVTVNHFWETLFGHGLVETSEDFGTQGDPPTHPELLDWLATEFMQNGWSMKKIQRLMVTSAAYREDSHVTPELTARDPYNKLYARGPRFRVEAEMVHDMALAESGLLSARCTGQAFSRISRKAFGTYRITTTSGSKAKVRTDSAARSIRSCGAALPIPVCRHTMRRAANFAPFAA